MRIKIFIASAILAAASSAAFGAPTSATVDFSNGLGGWVGSGAAEIDPRLGNEAPALRAVGAFDYLFWSTQANQSFLGNYGSVDSVTISFDLLTRVMGTDLMDLPAPLFLEFRDHSQPTSESRYASVWIEIGVADPGLDGWQHHSLTFATTSAQTLPPGWGGAGAVDEFNTPLLPAGRSFNDVMANVNEVIISSRRPGFFYNPRNVDVAIDNIALAVSPVPEPGSAALLLAGLSVLAWRRRKPMPAVGRAARRGGLALAIGTAAAMLAPHAQADIIDFENVESTLVGHDDRWRSGAFDLRAYSPDPYALPGDLAGAVIDGSDAQVCQGMACPEDNPGHFYAGLNDGILYLSATSPAQGIRFAGVDAAFVAALDNGPIAPVGALLVVRGLFANGQGISQTFELAGPGQPGFGFNSFSADTAFAQTTFVQLAFIGYRCYDTGNCLALSTNQGQFALDNLNVSAVPEPSAAALLASGLALLGVAARHTRRAA